MVKQFEDKDEFNRYISNVGKSDFDDMMHGGVSEKDIVKSLLADGYTDLDDLVADGHAYQIDGHTNNGWLYADEADMDYISNSVRQIEIRER